MGLIIEDGRGSGRTAAIDPENRLFVKSVIEQEASHISKHHGECYAWHYSFNVGAADTVLWLRNDSSVNYLYIDKVIAYCDKDTVMQLHFPDNVTPAGNLVDGLNLNRASGKLAEATCYGNETNNTQGPIVCDVNTTFIYFDVSGKIILGKNDALAIDYVGAATAIGGTTFIGFFTPITDIM